LIIAMLLGVLVPLLSVDPLVTVVIR
jgi:hypothetical protein